MNLLRFQLGMEIEVGGVLPFQGNKLAMHRHIVTDEDVVADSQLQRKALVVGGPDADSRSTFLCHLIIRIR
jgi:hypothetical protein